MEANAPRSPRQILRALHRDVGYLVVGLTLVFTLSGVLLVYRDTGLLQRATSVETKLTPGLEPDAVGAALRTRDFRVLRTAGDVVYFTGGSYDRRTGLAVHTERSYAFPLDRLVRLHRVASRQPAHWPVVLYGALLLFLAVSSFWMFRPGTPQFRRGLWLAALGTLLAVLLLALSPSA
jgi:hypothetical protein